MGTKADDAIASLTTAISNMEASVKPAAPTSDVAKADITNVKLSDPPSYELGQMVCNN